MEVTTARATGREKNYKKIINGLPSSTVSASSCLSPSTSAAWSFHPGSLCVFPPPPPLPPASVTCGPLIFNASTGRLYVRRSARVLQGFMLMQPLACTLCQRCLTSFGLLPDFNRKKLVWFQSRSGCSFEIWRRIPAFLIDLLHVFFPRVS